MEKTLVNIIIGFVLTAILGVIAFFLRRYVQQNDAFQEKTLGNFKTIRRSLDEQERAIQSLKFEIEQKLSAAGFDQITKNKISSLLASVAKIEKELTNIKPIMDKTKEDHGNVVWIVDKLKAQDGKIKGLYNVMTRIVNSQKT